MIWNAKAWEKRLKAGQKNIKTFLYPLLWVLPSSCFVQPSRCFVLPSFACFYVFFFHALAFFIKHPRFQTDKIFYSFYSFYPAKRFFLFLFFHPSHLRTIFFYEKLSSSSPEWRWSVQMLDNKKKKNRYTLIKTIKRIKRFYHPMIWNAKAWEKRLKARQKI